MRIIRLETTDSTNSYVAAHVGEMENMTLVYAENQTAGRGQRGNSWESAPGLNLTFTLFFQPCGLAPVNQFSISEATALGILDCLQSQGIEALIKWPNDIYVGDRKIAGILIENSVTSSHIDHSRIGVGLNVNQNEFFSDAPNPVSMIMTDGRRRNIDAMAELAAGCLENRLAQCAQPEGRESVHREFLKKLWRFDGREYKFRRKGEKGYFTGVICDVSRLGPLTVRDNLTGQPETFAFKEIEFVL